MGDTVFQPVERRTRAGVDEVKHPAFCPDNDAVGPAQVWMRCRPTSRRLSSDRRTRAGVDEVVHQEQDQGLRAGRTRAGMDEVAASKSDWSPLASDSHRCCDNQRSTLGVASIPMPVPRWTEQEPLTEGYYSLLALHACISYVERWLSQHLGVGPAQAWMRWCLAHVIALTVCRTRAGVDEVTGIGTFKASDPRRRG